MRILFILACLSAFSSSLQAAGEVTPKAVHPLTGTWSWALFAGSCMETWQYRADGTLLATSGQEVAEKTYQVAMTPDAAGFYQLVETVVRQNDKKDCAGNLLSGPGEQSNRFLQFSPLQDKLLVCREASLKACFGPLIKVR